ncbi:PE family protein PE12 [Mycobacterium kubicae]|uniref:PE family protein n=1 Tax=Mycobacterium kubicae TaxID=120959 RepID=A0AAX1J8N6_9MYCO|nr:PE family protein [Mycobacterium kubicae]MCV7096575.1 PE family protein [Mycobacterium kubicae]ORW01795.1 PE family protein [Mycobacterium kubicae]QNI13231.1 PE family protein [Mycobacterium kubicae]QPI36749.1 PE family protein [Mycobacterium kubicae]GFG67260.1 PE family protein PE12 [Mycobacterium kubicae]
MSNLLAAPQALVAAAADVAGIGSDINAASAAAAMPTTGIAAAAADDVSTQVAALFSKFGQGYQQLSSQLATFHTQFTEALRTSANAYAAAEASAAQTLASAANGPAHQLLEGPLLGGGAVVSDAVGRVQSAVAGVFGTNVTGAPAAAATSALSLAATGGNIGRAASSALSAAAAAVAAPAAVIPVSVATAIEEAYLAVEPYVQYGFNLASYAAGWLPWVGILAPQINFFYYLFEPMVQSALFNTLDWLDGTISFAQGLNNFWSATSASVNQFIYNEWYWIRGFLPPLPPLPPL